MPRWPGEGWRSPTLRVGSLALAVAFSLFGDMTMYALLPVAYESLPLTPLQVGIILSANRWVRLLTNDVARRALGRGNPAAWLTVFLLLGSAIAAFYAARPAFPLLLAARMLWGLCWSFIRHAGVMSSVGRGEAKRTGRMLGLYQGVVQAGFIAGSFLGALLFDLRGYPSAFSIMAAASLCSIPFGLLGLRKEDRAHFVHPRSAARAAPLDVTLLARGFIVACVGTGLIMSTLGYMLKSRLGDSVSIGPLVIGVATLNGALLAARYLTSSVGSPILGALTDRAGRHRSQLGAFAVGGVALLAPALSVSAAVLLPAVLLFFLCSVLCRLAMDAEAAQSGPGGYSRLATASDLGAALGPLLGWLGIEYTRHAPAVFLTGAALFALAALLTLIGGSRRRDARG